MKDKVDFQHGFIRLKTAIIIAAVFVVGALLVAVLMPKDPAKERSSANTTGYEAAAEQFVKAMSKKEGQTSYALLTDRYKKVVGSQDDWQKQLDVGFKDGDGSPKLAKSEVQPDPANIYKGKDPKRVTYEFDFAGVKWNTTLLVLKDGDSWKIDQVDSEQQK